MKTSFYFLLWIAIYPLLGLLESEWIDGNSFFVALIFVWVFSYTLNRAMPETIAYEKKLSLAEILNDVYVGNVEGLRRRLKRMCMVEMVSALYFGVTFLLSLWMLIGGANSDFVSLIVFGFLAAGTVSRANKLYLYASRLRRNPDPQESVGIVEEMGMDYPGYYEERQSAERDAIMPPAPKHFAVFEIVSLVAAVICTLLGVALVIWAIIGILMNPSFGATSFGIVFLLYGSLATYFGIKDSITSLNYFKLRSYIGQLTV